MKYISLVTVSVFLTSCGLLMSDPAPAEIIPKAVPVEKAKPVKPAATVKQAGSKSLKTYTGIASWYSIKTNGNNTKTASGRPLSNNAYTAAHKTLPFGTKVRITCLFNGKSEVLTITDRGPYIKGRIIDVTIGSAKRLGFYDRGITKVKVEVLSYGNWKYKKP